MLESKGINTPNNNAIIPNAYAQEDLQQQQARTDADNNGPPIDSCRCVVFRFDDVQDNFAQSGQIAAMDLFLLKNQSLSLGLIMNDLGEDHLVIDKTKEGLKRGLFEIAIHGWNHDDYSKMSRYEQWQDLKKANEKINLMFGNTSDIFITPFNKFDGSTLDAMKDLKLSIISSEVDLDKYPYYFSIDARSNSDTPPDLPYHFPITTAFRSKNDTSTDEVKAFVKISVGEILREIDTSIEKHGYAAVMMHPQDFIKSKDGTYTNEVDASQIKDLSVLIDSVLKKGLRITTFSEIAGIQPKVYDTHSYYNVTYGADKPINVFTHGAAPAGVAVNPVTNMVYVTNAKSNTVSVIDGTTNTLLVNVKVGNTPFGIAVNPSTNRIYVINWQSDSVSVIDGSNNRLYPATLPIENTPFGIAVNPSTNRIYVINWQSDSVSVIDGDTNLEIDSIKLAGRIEANSNSSSTTASSGGINSRIGLSSIAINVKTDRIFVGSTTSNTIFVIDALTDDVIGTITGLAAGPDRIAVNPVTNMVYVTNAKSNAVSVIDGKTNTLVSTIGLDFAPQGIAVNHVTNMVYVTNAKSNAVSVINGEFNDIVSSFSTGLSPANLAFNANTGMLYIANADSNSISVIDSENILVVPEFPLPTILMASGLVIVSLLVAMMQKKTRSNTLGLP